MTENRIRILHIASLHNYLSSGVGVVVPQHIRAQQKYADVALLNIFDLEIPGIEKQLTYTPDFSWKTLEGCNFIPDIVIFHEVYHIEFCKIARQLLQRNIPYVVVPHGCMARTAQRKKRLKKTIANCLIFRHFLLKSSAIQFLSKKEMDDTAKTYKSCGFIGTNGVNLPNDEHQVNISNVINGIYIGRLEPYIKGIDLLVKAISLKKQNLLAAGFSINMYGPDLFQWHEQIRKMASEEDICDIISVFNPVFEADKYEVIENANIFIQTSRTEGMPMGILEALSYGVPCLVTKGTNLGEIIEEYDAGWVAETTAESIADKLEQAVSEKDKWEMKSRNARKLIEDNFEWGKVAACAIEKYIHIIARG